MMELEDTSDVDLMRDEINSLREKLKMSGKIGQELLNRLDKAKEEIEVLKEDIWVYEKEKNFFEQKIQELKVDISKLREENYRLSEKVYFTSNTELQSNSDEIPDIGFNGSPVGRNLYRQIEKYKELNNGLEAKIQEDLIERNALNRKIEMYEQEILLLKSSIAAVRVAGGEVDSNGDGSPVKGQLQQSALSTPTSGYLRNQNSTSPNKHGEDDCGKSPNHTAVLIESLKRENSMLTSKIQELEKSMLMLKVRNETRNAQSLISSRYIVLWRPL